MFFTNFIRSGLSNRYLMSLGCPWHTRNATAYPLKLRGELELKFSPISPIFYLIGAVLLVITRTIKLLSVETMASLGWAPHPFLINKLYKSFGVYQAGSK